jgi:thiol-disulfide isomerase/thioredoxin
MMARVFVSKPSTRATSRAAVSTQPTQIKWADRVEIRRIALDPMMGFMPVRLTLDSQLIVDPKSDLARKLPPVIENHESEMVVTSAIKTQSGLWVPQEATLTDFSNGQTVLHVTHLRVSKVTLNQPQPASEFVLQFPVGCKVYDGIRHIGYQVGESQTAINQRLAKASEEDQFFAGILGKPAPGLQGRRWLVGQPLRLEELKGRPIILHFWNIWCGSCIAEIPQLQQFHGRQNDNEPIFISVHTGGDESDLLQIQKFIRDKGITFPVMWDASDTAQKGWGLTSEAYGINGIPTDAFIDAEGHLQSVGDHNSQKK